MKKLLLSTFALFSLFTNAQTTNYVLNFNGSSNYVDLGVNVGTAVRSIEFWFNPSANITTSITSTGHSLVVRNDAQLHEYGFYIKGTDWTSGRGSLNFYMYDNGTFREVSSNSSSWTSNTWYHVCGTIDATTGMKLYINGVLQTSTNSLGTAAIVQAPEITALGRWGDTPIRFFSGKIDEVRFWNRTLTQTEISAKMCYWLVPINETGLTSYWRMNEGTGLSIIDATTGNNNGTINGATYVQDNMCFIGYVGVNELYNHATVSVYPNPFSSQAQIKLSEIMDDASLIIYNAIGQEVKQLKHLYGENITINRDELQSGMYFFNIISKNKIVATQKLVITDK